MNFIRYRKPHGKPLIGQVSDLFLQCLRLWFPRGRNTADFFCGDGMCRACLMFQCVCLVCTGPASLSVESLPSEHKLKFTGS